MKKATEHGKHLFMAAFGPQEDRANHLAKAMEVGTEFELFRLSKGFDPKYSNNEEIRAMAHKAFRAVVAKRQAAQAPQQYHPEDKE